MMLSELSFTLQSLDWILYLLGIQNHIILVELGHVLHPGGWHLVLTGGVLSQLLSQLQIEELFRHSQGWQLLSGAVWPGQGDMLVTCTPPCLLCCEVGDFCPLQCKWDLCQWGYLNTQMYLPAFFFKTEFISFDFEYLYNLKIRVSIHTQIVYNLNRIIVNLQVYMKTIDILFKFIFQLMYFLTIDIFTILNRL